MILLLLLILTAIQLYDGTDAACCSGAEHLTNFCVNYDKQFECETYLNGSFIVGQVCQGDGDDDGVDDVCEATCGDGVLQSWENCDDALHPTFCTDCKTSTHACCSYVSGTSTPVCFVVLSSSYCQPSHSVDRHFIANASCDPNVCPIETPLSAICQEGQPCCITSIWLINLILVLVTLGVLFICFICILLFYYYYARDTEEEEEEDDNKKKKSKLKYRRRRVNYQAHRKAKNY